MDPTTLPTFQNLPAHLRDPFLRAVRSNPLEWLLPPISNETFESSTHCLARLQAYALGQGFAVVTGKVYRDGTPRWQFLCIHHGQVQQKLDCKWQCLLSTGECLIVTIWESRSTRAFTSRGKVTV